MSQPSSSGFVNRAPEWQRLRELLSRAAGNSGLQNLTEQELWELPSLYRKALSDLSLIRSARIPGTVEQELSQLCNQAHSLIYAGTQRKRSAGAMHYLMVELPQTARRQSRLILFAALVMSLFAALGFIHSLAQPEVAEAVMGPYILGYYQAQLEGAREEADLQLAAQIAPEERPSAWLYITINNIMVSFNALMYGVLGGVPSIFVLAFNGYMVGALGYVYFNSDPGIDINLPLYFIAGIAPHGSIELPAICIAAAAGMLLGFSWVFPGGRPRGQAFREAVPDALRLIMICVVTLIVAGVIEGFITPLRSPAGVPLNLWFAAKIAVGLVIFGFWLIWLSQGGQSGRQTAKKQAASETEAAAA
ncbi:stage II sporulation protein M [bacterium]|nr:stage II sporulation protein M [bacterium]